MAEAAFIPAARPQVGEDEEEAVLRVLRSGMLAQGPEVAAFESEFSALVDNRHCVAVNSGTSALHLALLAMGIRRGDEVLVPSFTFAASANAVAIIGAVPVFVDIDPDTFCMDPAAAEAAVTDRTRAIMPVHLYGHPAAMDEIMALATRHDLLVIEDAAQAHGASLHGTPVGAFGATAAFSFYPTKNMTSGEGGMVATGCDHLARSVQVLRNQGMEKRYANERVGLNNRMTDLHAAIGRAQLMKLDGWTKARQANAAFFDEALDGVVVPPVADDAVHVYHQYTIRTPGHNRDAFVAALSQRGVGAGVYYPTPVHRLPSYGLRLDLPATEQVAGEVVSLPIYPSLTADERDRVATAVNDVARAGV